MSAPRPRKRFEEAVRATLVRRELLGGPPEERVHVACSSGADSTALALVLHALGHPLSLVYVDHQARPDTADDAAFVAALATALGAPFTSLTLPDGVRPTEDAWREARYAALDGLAPGPVALGHTLDDQAETVIQRLLRGTGTAGLGGIPPRRGRYVRPLIDRRRSENVEYLEALGQAWREDPSNATARFQRNRVRSRVLPLLEAEAPEVAVHLAHLADIAREEQLVLQSLARDFLCENGLVRGALARAPAGLLAAVLREACPVVPSAERLAALRGLVLGGRGVIQLSQGYAARFDGRGRSARLVFVRPEVGGAG